MLQNISLAESARTAISMPCCCVPRMQTDWNGLPTFLDGGNSVADKAVAPFNFTFSSNDNVYEVSFETYQFELKEGSMQTEYEMSVCVSMKPGNVFYRLYRTVKYLSGYCSCYGDFDSFEFTQTDAEKFHLIASGLRAC